MKFPHLACWDPFEAGRICNRHGNLPPGMRAVGVNLDIARPIHGCNNDVGWLVKLGVIEILAAPFCHELAVTIEDAADAAHGLDKARMFATTGTNKTQS